MAVKTWRTEDWVAVYLGFFIIAATLAAFSWKFVDLRGAVPSFRWTTDAQMVSRAPDWGTALEGIAKEAEGKGQKEIAAKANDLKATLQKGDRKAVEKAAGDLAKVGGRNTVPGSLGSEIRGHAAAVADAKVFTWDNLSKVVYIGIIWLVVGVVGIALIGGKAGAFVIGFP